MMLNNREVEPKRIQAACWPGLRGVSLKASPPNWTTRIWRTNRPKTIMMKRGLMQKLAKGLISSFFRVLALKKLKMVRNRKTLKNIVKCCRSI